MRTREFLPGLWGAFFVFAAAGCNGGGGGETHPADAGSDAPDVILDGGGPIPDPPDGAAACPKGACNYQTDEGCQATQSCVPLPDGKGAAPPGCIGAGTGKSGEACQNFDQCAPGLICAGGACRKLCCGGDWTGCGSASEHCLQSLVVGDGMGGKIPTGAMLCLPVNTCDALVPTSCPTAGESCQIVDPTGATACLKEGTADIGQSCKSAACKGGSLCVKDACRRLCKAVEGGGEPSCKPGEGICIHYNRDPAGVGECTPETTK
jgi:hypothetical protein